MSGESPGTDALPVQHRKPAVDADAVARWLCGHLGAAALEVTSLPGGFWSAAFAYQHDGVEYVVRFNDNAEGFEIDRAACAFARTGLPVPEVLEIGAALGVSYAISRRHHGRFLELTEPEAAPRLTPALADLFARMRRVPSRERVEWYKPTGNQSWHDYLLRGIGDDAGAPQDGWHAALQSRPELHDLYQTASRRIHELLPLCPERRDLVHGDLLHQNVLVSDQADSIEALFSWKCSAFGDFAYDIAWCSHWAPWHPGIAAIDFYELTLNSSDLNDAARKDLGARQHCYELQIATSHIGWYLCNGDEENLGRLCRGLRRNLARGPRN